MATLDPSLRDQLATVIGKENADTGARIIAEAAARAAIEALAVHLASPHDHLDPGQRQLRNRLRARARQLGDARHADARHETGRLVEQAAYEHWHRMLFARFLAENDLLIHPEMKVAVTLAECAELAASEGAADGWELAGRYASRMLPQIFRPDDPLLAVRFAIDDVKKLEVLLDSLPADLFTASDSLGWCYQFWQARKKKEVNASEVKIGADELPAVTQLFTEPYMVQFLLHNTLGAWWVGAGRALPVEMPYLRVRDDGTPAAGTFEGWPRLARELKVLDPCCGSGHFLVAAFEILVAFRVAEEGLTAREACDAVLRDNLFGLEIDARCVQIAAFALAMAAWTYPDAGGYRPLAPMNVACSGLAISAKKEEWERLGGDNPRLRAGMGRMWELFKDAPVLGSLIDAASLPSDLFSNGGEAVVRHLVLLDDGKALSPDIGEEVAAALSLSAALRMIRGKYSLVATNVPFLGLERQSETLSSHLKSQFEPAKRDLSTSFFERCCLYAANGCTSALVMPGEWTFLRPHREFRKRLLEGKRIEAICRLGINAFSYSVRASPVLLLASNAEPAIAAYLDVSDFPFDDKRSQLTTTPLVRKSQKLWLENVDARIFNFEDDAPALPTLAAFADAAVGLSAGDSQRFEAQFWEVPEVGRAWQFLQSSVSRPLHYGGRTKIVLWEDENGSMAQLAESVRQLNHAAQNWRRGKPLWGRSGVTISLMGDLHATLYSGDRYDINCCAIVPKSEDDVLPLAAFALSGELGRSVRKFDHSLKVGSPKTLLSAPFDRAHWLAVAEDMFGGQVPSPVSADPTQWVFAGAPRASDAPLQVAVARLLGYRWPDQQPDALDAHADKDGIVCLPALRGERPAADRLAELLAAAYAPDWHPQTLTDLLAAVGHAGSLEEWLRDAFFQQHCILFHHRPFIWHIWDGHREGFSALVNYHKLDHEGLKSLTYSYLGDWIRTQELEAQAGQSGAGARLAKARALQQRLAAILEGEAPLDIFVRWKPLEQQPLGWHPDLDDGVRLNIRPFLTVADVGAKGAGVLRWKPNIKWGKDRGKNPPGSPWGEDRDNDVHLTLAEKRAAREES
jgi:hypothetical protein